MPLESLASVVEPYDPRARPRRGDQRRADLIASLEQLIHRAVLHGAIGIAHGFFAASDGRLNRVEVLLGIQPSAVNPVAETWTLDLSKVS